MNVIDVSVSDQEQGGAVEAPVPARKEITPKDFLSGSNGSEISIRNRTPSNSDERASSSGCDERLNELVADY